ncbi:DNA-binding protein [Longimicrobium terrae]|uniref:DNA-binding protein n=1 Tax=Longimicrobium terrae TaxID=1639882 RepID=A0A841GLY4_9BACT|nr:DNA-binding protein [Longimicrobium terrae]MBB4635397.1 hypothetical protein [Longimicrobium terrae]MBB6069791.1 hypothetical protein [Longimicrobium terrae]NNC31000.1 DNA-binding protein [Longimicrobium terrae]
MTADVTESDLPTTFGAPARRALVNAGITRLEQLSRVSERELLKLHGMGPRAVRLLRDILAGHGLGFADAGTIADATTSQSTENA